MAWELRKERYHDMNKERTLSLISACNIEVPIYKEDYDYIIRGENFKKAIDYKESKILSHFSDSEYKEELKKKLHISVLPDYRNNNFFIGFSPRDIINSVFEVLETNKRVNFDYSNPIEYYCAASDIKEYIKTKYLNKIVVDMNLIFSGLSSCKTEEQYNALMYEYNTLKEKYDFIKSFYNSIDYIFDLYKDKQLNKFKSSKIFFDVQRNVREEVKDCHIAWRNLANYMAVSCLNEYENTNKSIYLQYPYKFYEKCTKVGEDGKQMLYVNELYYGNEKFDSKFFNYNRKCEKMFKESPLRIEFLLGYKDNNMFVVYETLNPGSIMISDENFGDFLAYKASKTDKKKKDTRDYLIAEKQFMSKAKFYSHNPDFLKHLYYRMYRKEDNETGYVGFILDNDYIVLDKFFKESDDGRCEYAKDAAVYALPLDLYEKLHRNSGEIRNYKENIDTKGLVLRKYHTDKESYTDALIKLTKKESVSLLSAEQFVRQNGIIPVKKEQKSEEKDIKRKTKKSKKNKNNKKD